MENEKRLIDANKVINAMQKCLDEFPDKKDTVAYFAFKSFITILKQEPTVDAVEVAHGRWELVEYKSSQFGVDQEYQCSICGTPVDDENYRTRYCPNCGADMRGDSDA